MIKELTVNELFTGIGAVRKALERLKIPHKVIGISEIDKYSIKSYEAIFGETRNYGNISKIEKLDYADFWSYGFPCQSISISGKQEGIIKGQTRSGLLYEVERLLNVAKEYNELPQYLLLENVKNLVGKKFKPDFDKWLEYLDDLGYNNYWSVLNSKFFGVPQNRERVFVVSIRKNIDDKTFEFPKPFDNGIRLKDVLEENVDEKYYLRQELQDKFREQFLHKLNLTETTGCHVSNKGNNIEGITDICSTLMARDYKGFGNQRMTGVAELQQVGTLKGCGMPYDKMHDQSGRVYDPDGIAPTVHCMGGGNLEPKILQKSRGYNKDGLHEDCPTISSHTWECNNFLVETKQESLIEPLAVASRGRNTDNPSDRAVGIPTEQRFEVNYDGVSNCLTTVQKDSMVMEPQVLRSERTEYGKQIRKAYEAGKIKESRHNMREMIPRKDGMCNTLTTVQNDNLLVEPYEFRIRKLTPCETWRLQDFDDTDFDKAQAVCSNTQLYKQAGNSITVGVLYYIFKNLFKNYLTNNVIESKNKSVQNNVNFTQPPMK